MKKFNFKWCVYILLCAMLLPVSMLFITPKGVASAEGFIVNEQQGEITSITGDFVGMKVNSYQDVYLALNNFKSTFNFKNSEDSLVFTKQVKSLTGTVYRFYQKVQGLKVFGSEVIVNTNQDGRIMSINCSYFKNIALNKEVNHSIEEATKVVKSQYEATKVVYLEENIFPSEENCRCYVFEVHMYDDVYNVLVCANHLEVVKVVKSTASLDDVMMESLPSLQDYTKIDLQNYVTDILEENSENTYYAFKNPVFYQGTIETYNHFSLNILPSNFENNGYKLVFELYDGTEKIGTIEKKFIVK